MFSLNSRRTARGPPMSQCKMPPGTGCKHRPDRRKQGSCQLLSPVPPGRWAPRKLVRLPSSLVERKEPPAWNAPLSLRRNVEDTASRARAAQTPSHRPDSLLPSGQHPGQHPTPSLRAPPSTRTFWSPLPTPPTLWCLRVSCRRDAWPRAGAELLVKSPLTGWVVGVWAGTQPLAWGSLGPGVRGSPRTSSRGPADADAVI